MNTDDDVFKHSYKTAKSRSFLSPPCIPTHFYYDDPATTKWTGHTNGTQSNYVSTNLVVVM